jgi:hypothetical protein
MIDPGTCSMSIPHTLDALLVSVLIAAISVGAAPTAKSSGGNNAKAIVTDYFAQVKNHAPGDLVSRGQVREVLDRVEKRNGKLADRAKLEQKVLADDSFLVTKLRSSSGTKFMRQIASMPLGYDQLDRMSQLPQGRGTVERLVRGPDGYKLLEYMTKEPGGKDMAKMLSKDGAGNFNKPTGKIYTAEQLVKELEH